MNLKTIDQQLLVDDQEILFVEFAADQHRGRPVGMMPEGVLVYHFPGLSRDVEIVPFDQIDCILFSRETRVRRIWNSLWLATAMTALGLAGLAFFDRLFVSGGASFDGLSISATILTFLVAIVGPFGLLTVPWWLAKCFTRLGVQLAITSQRKKGKYLFEPKDWEEKEPAIRKLLAKHYPNSVFEFDLL